MCLITCASLRMKAFDDNIVAALVGICDSCLTMCGRVCAGLPLTQMIVGQGQSVPFQPIVAQQAVSSQAAPPSSGASSVRLHGEGLSKATVGHTAQFVVDSKGNRGDLHILVEGILYLYTRYTDILHLYTTPALPRER